MKYHFPYQKVLEYKEKQQDIAKQEYGVVKLRQVELEQEIEVLEVVEEEIFQQYNQVNRKTVAEIMEIQADINNVSQRKKHLENQSVKIHQEVESKQLVLLERSQETKIWNKWKSQSLALFQKQLEQKEQAMLDEMAVLRYARKI